MNLVISLGLGLENCATREQLGRRFASRRRTLNGWHGENNVGPGECGRMLGLGVRFEKAPQNTFETRLHKS